MKLSEAQQEALADRLFAAAKAGIGIDPPSESTDYGFEDAYRVRRKLVDRLIADGGRPRGHKIGFTSTAMQEMYGMTGPDFGILLDTMFLPANRPVRVTGKANTRAEPELAFELARPLKGPGVTIKQAIAACSKVYAAIEIIDSRVGAMRARATDSLADNAGAGYVVLGDIALDPITVDYAAITLTQSVDDEHGAAPASDVMGHPAAPLAWLANKLPELDGLGGELAAGDIVITGSPVRSVAVQKGSRLTATFGVLGTINLEFV